MLLNSDIEQFTLYYSGTAMFVCISGICLLSA
ncbi:MAG: hypothetical protein JWP58_2206 [Hymenobacter sp.]|nr:hypothetical protein [Hymenobacter sp.]